MESISQCSFYIRTNIESNCHVGVRHACYIVFSLCNCLVFLVLFFILYRFYSFFCEQVFGLWGVYDNGMEGLLIRLLCAHKINNVEEVSLNKKYTLTFRQNLFSQDVYTMQQRSDDCVRRGLLAPQCVMQMVKAHGVQGLVELWRSLEEHLCLLEILTVWVPGCKDE